MSDANYAQREPMPSPVPTYTTTATTASFHSPMPADPWVHRSSGMRCATCIWFVPKGEQPNTRVGRCRRHAPSMGGYPVVFASDWCGDHRLDENKA